MTTSSPSDAIHLQSTYLYSGHCTWARKGWTDVKVTTPVCIRSQLLFLTIHSPSFQSCSRPQKIKQLLPGAAYHQPHRQNPNPDPIAERCFPWRAPRARRASCSRSSSGVRIRAAPHFFSFAPIRRDQPLNPNPFCSVCLLSQILRRIP
jgi:hypothetical protein